MKAKRTPGEVWIGEATDQLSRLHPYYFLTSVPRNSLRATKLKTCCQGSLTG